MKVSVRFYLGGHVIDQRPLAVVPRMGEGVSLDGETYFVGAVSHRLEADDQEVDLVLIKKDEAQRFLGAQR